MEILSSTNFPLSYQRFFQFVHALDNDFVPSLSSRVDLKRYVQKLLKEAEVIYCEVTPDLAGAIAFYNNNLIDKVAYISYLAVNDNFRGNGIAGKLLDACLKRCKEVKMNTVLVETWDSNVPVISLYKSKGFFQDRVVQDRDGHSSVKLKLVF